MGRLGRGGALLVACAAALAGLVATASGSTGLGTPIVEPDAGYAPIYALLSSPKHSLDMTMYELKDTKAEQALIADAARGVAVRVLLDQAFSGASVNKAAFANLMAHGVSVRAASTQVAITHQKSFVIDKKKAVIMTGNLTSQYYSTSRDYALTDAKATDVAAIETTFGIDWANAKGTAPTGADLVWSPGAQAPLVALIASAKKTLQVENEEMSATAIVSALVAAARKGVDVRVVMTDQASWHKSFDTLKAAGVQIRTYSPSAKLYVHAKTIEVDGKRVFLGSQNFSASSRFFCSELGLVTTATAVVKTVAATFATDFAGAAPWS
jgi:phosphatidylserine/phosphatidylglycerophosphate/cardiolipin synthase-like enzyme